MKGWVILNETRSHDTACPSMPLSLCFSTVSEWLRYDSQGFFHSKLLTIEYRVDLMFYIISLCWFNLPTEQELVLSAEVWLRGKTVIRTEFSLNTFFFLTLAHSGNINSCLNPHTFHQKCILGSKNPIIAWKLLVPVSHGRSWLEALSSTSYHTSVMPGWLHRKQFALFFCEVWVHCVCPAMPWCGVTVEWSNELCYLPLILPICLGRWFFVKKEENLLEKH